MSQPDRQGPIINSIAFIQMASMITDKEYPFNRAGEKAAKADLRAQHERVRLQRSPIEIMRMVRSNDPVIQITADTVSTALQDGDYQLALQSANFLHGYGDLDHRDGLGGQAFQLSLQAHRLFAGIIFGRYSAVDDFLKSKGQRVLSDARAAGEHGMEDREYDILRGTIHTVVVNGTLGNDTKQFVDPFAIVKVE